MDTQLLVVKMAVKRSFHYLFKGENVDVHQAPPASCQRGEPCPLVKIVDLTPTDFDSALRLLNMPHKSDETNGANLENSQ